jgi:c-di-GMP-related signal transduction protein
LKRCLARQPIFNSERLDMRMSDVLKEIAVRADIRDALTGKSNALRDIFDSLLNYERGNWEDLASATEGLGIRDEVIGDVYLASWIGHRRFVGTQ